MGECTLYLTAWLSAHYHMIQFIAVRKTLEANMHMTHLYPPGRVYWAQRDGSLHPSLRVFPSGSEDRIRLFEVLDVGQVFNQIIFSRDMLR